MVVIGVFAMRWNVVVGGQTISKSLRGYVEYEWIFGGREGVFMASLILCVPLLLYAVLVRLLPPWVEEAPALEAAHAAAAWQPALSLVGAGGGGGGGGGGAGSSGGGNITLLQPKQKRYIGLKLALAGLGTAMAALAFGVMAAPGSPGLLQIGGSQPEPLLVPQLRTAFPAKQLASFGEPAGGSWIEPLDVTVMGDRIFVLDHAGQQVVEIDPQGRFVRSYSGRTVPGLALQHPHAMVNDGTDIYIGNTFPPAVYVLDPRAGLLKRTLVLPPGGVDGVPAVPTGIAFQTDGNLVVSDGQNHRLLVVSPDGATARVVNRSPGSWDLITPNSRVAGTAPAAALSIVASTGRPGGVGIARDGAILAVDILGPGIVRVLGDGSLGAEFARPSDPKSGIFTPTDVAVDALGRIFVSDDLLQGIQVYGADGASLGVIGRGDPNSFTAPAEMRHPSALAVQGDKLYVVDRGRAVLVYQLPGLPQVIAQVPPGP
jgi:DNA-binding beta-propeller fold protein YncE